MRFFNLLLPPPNQYIASGIAIYYYRCKKCKFIFTKAFDDFSNEEFQKYIYNDDYIVFDPDYNTKRPMYICDMLINNLFLSKHLNILDYGCGNGNLVKMLQKNGYNIKGYDPFSKKFNKIPKKINLI